MEKASSFNMGGRHCFYIHGSEQFCNTIRQFTCCLHFPPPVIRARILKSSFNESTQERKFLVKVIKVFKSVVKLKERQEIFVVNDYCKCPDLSLQKQYVIMGTAEQITVSEVRLLIPPRPFVKMWNSLMQSRYQAIGDICDD